MELIFLGRGAAFNPKENNNSAYFIEDNNLFLIDCGETVFKELIINNILENIKDIYVFITHTHSDHIGSIGTLASYFYHKKNNKINIVIPTNPDKNKYLNYIKNILESTNCLNKYNLITETDLDNKYTSFKEIRYRKTTHSKELTCYAIIFNTNQGYIYYSGDSNETSIIEELIKENKPIDKMYFDTTTNDSIDNPHLNIDKLNNTIPSNLKDKVYCMHIDSDLLLKKAKELNLKIIEKK